MFTLFSKNLTIRITFQEYSLTMFVKFVRKIPKEDRFQFPRKRWKIFIFFRLYFLFYDITINRTTNTLCLHSHEKGSISNISNEKTAPSMLISYIRQKKQKHPTKTT